MRRKATTWNYCWPDDPQPGLLHLEPPALSKKSSFSIQCCGGTSEEQDEMARRIAALWNAAEDIESTTKEIEDGVIQFAFELGEHHAEVINAAKEHIEKLEEEKAESEHALGFAVEAVERLEAEKRAIVDILEKILVDYTTGRTEYNIAYALAAQSIITKERKEK